MMADFTDIWIADLVETGQKLLDIGSGHGQLLAFLEEKKQIRGQGIDINHENVRVATQRGLPVIQADADVELANYPDNSFDVVVLSRTLQAMKHPRDVLDQALRIGRQVVVVIPNFGHIRNRLYLLLRGRMPVTSSLSYQWYETPNIHFCTIKDMVTLAEELQAVISHRYQLNAGVLKRFCGNGRGSANLFAQEGVFVLTRESGI